MRKAFSICRSIEVFCNKVDMALMTLCRFPGCRKPVPRGERYCAAHAEKGRLRDEAQEARAKQFREKRRRELRGSSSDRGYGYRWQKLRNRFIAQHPLCQACQAKGIIRMATDVDHIVPHRGDPELLYDEVNLQSLCHECHSRKTAREDGGFGNRRYGGRG